jgi:hypothetical protein
MGSGMIFVELRGTRILTEGDSRFYTQPEVGRVNVGWLLPSVPVWPFPNVLVWLLPNVPVWLLPNVPV